VSDSLLPPEGFRTRGPKPTGTRLLLIRHGEAVCNAEGIVGGPKGCGGLTELGRAQAFALAARLAHSGELASASQLYCSVLPRAIETAAIVAPHVGSGMTAIEDCALCELHPGEGDGLAWDEFVARFGAPDWDENPGTPLAPGGESWSGFAHRCWDAFAELTARHEGELVVVVAHGGVVEQLLKLVYGRDAGARLRLRTENCSMTEAEFRKGAWHLLRYNDRAPLAAG
jgi:2,3-bisphosphoglycerate-dependent phosphoglycerate mutase